MTGFMIFGHILTGLFGIGLLAGLGYVVWAWFAHPRNFANMASLALIGLSAPALMFAVLATLLYFSGGRRVYVYDEGVVFLGRRKRIACRWEDIQFVWQKLTVVTVLGVSTTRGGTLTVQLKDGRRWYVDNTLVEEIFELSDLVQEKITNVQLQPARDQFENGDLVAFGELAISKERIVLRDRSVPWSHVTRVALSGGSLVVEIAGDYMPWCTCPLEAIPNYFLLLRLVDRIMPVS
jgi:hypothetical protein